MKWTCRYADRPTVRENNLNSALARGQRSFSREITVIITGIEQTQRISESTGGASTGERTEPTGPDRAARFAAEREERGTSRHEVAGWGPVALLR